MARTGRPPTPAIERFSAKIAVDAISGCHEWTAGRDKDGYAQFKDKGRTVRGARWIYEFRREHIGPGLTVDHLCKNTGCVNPDHLEAVSMQVNVLRSGNRAAIASRKTECVRGHPLSGSNLFVCGGRRYCRQCHRIRARIWKERRSECRI